MTPGPLPESSLCAPPPEPFSVLLYCRQGFEAECSQELAQRTRPFGSAAVSCAAAGSAFALVTFTKPQDPFAFSRTVSFASLTFARQLIFVVADVANLMPGNRVQPVVDAVAGKGHVFSDIFLETADTNEAKQLSPLCRKLEIPFRDALSKAGAFAAPTTANHHDVKRLHVFFESTNHAMAGFSYVNNSSPWPMGIARLRFPSGAPSRSALKLEEAWHVFLTETQMSSLLLPGLSAVDLGACPGGWSWQLAARGLCVTAVDNGRMDKQVLATGLVRHVRADAFAFHPASPVHWMVCDVVEQPSRIARLAAQWVARSWCKASIFNLKLPMKKRLEEVLHCRDIIFTEMQRAKKHHTLLIKHLYHDREEVTAFLSTL